MRKHCGVSDPLPPAAAVPLPRGTVTTRNRLRKTTVPLERGTAVERSDRQGIARAVSLLVAFAVLSAALVSFSAVSIDRLRTHVTALSNPAMEGRHAGTPGAALAAD